MNKKKILIVDDVKSNINILMQCLKDEYDLIPALSGVKAFKALEILDIDLILLDIIMPDMDGYEVCEILKNKIETKVIPVIFITAESNKESIDKAYKVGGIDYIIKPFNKENILEKVSIHI